MEVSSAIERALKIVVLAILCFTLPFVCVNLEFATKSLIKIAYNPVCTGGRS